MVDYVVVLFGQVWVVDYQGDGEVDYEQYWYWQYVDDQCGYQCYGQGQVDLQQFWMFDVFGVFYGWQWVVVVGYVVVYLVVVFGQGYYVEVMVFFQVQVLGQQQYVGIGDYY